MPRRLPGLLLAGLVSFMSSALSAAEALPAAAFGAIPRMSSVEMSPDGKMLAWQEVRPEGSFVVMFDLAVGEVRLTIPAVPEVRLRSLTWADNETLLITVSNFAAFGQNKAADHYEVFRTYAVDVVGGKQRMMLMSSGERAFVTGATLLAWRVTKPKTVIMSTIDWIGEGRIQTGSRVPVGRKDSGWVSQVFEVDTRTGKGVPLATGTPFTDDWIVNRNGEPVARSEWNPALELYTILARAGGGWREIFRQQNRGGLDLHGLTKDEAAIIATSTDATGREYLRTIPLDGSEGQPLLGGDLEGVAGVSYDRITREPVRVFLGGLEQSTRWIDKDAEIRFRRVAGAFKGQRVEVYGRSEDGQRVLASVESPSSPPVFYFIDFTKNSADIIGEAYPGLVGAKLGEVRAIHYKARDGESVPAYLTLPPAGTATKLPLVVLPHGGPEARDDFAFDWWAQFLASRGYAVLQPQFRGSTGFGEAWRLAGHRQWGQLMQDDVTDGVTAMVEQGIADAARVCIVGASYGGYAALAGAAFTPDLYRCAASINGVSDLPSMIVFEQDHRGRDSDAVAYWREHIGSPRDPQVIEKSPLRAAAQIRIPVLLMHAVNDTVVPQSQSQSLSRALDKMKKKVTYVSLKGEDHWLSQTATRVQMLTELEKFLDVNLRSVPEVTAAH